MGKILEKQRKFSDESHDAFLEEIKTLLEKAVELKNHGKEKESNEVMQEVKMWLDNKARCSDRLQILRFRRGLRLKDDGVFRKGARHGLSRDYQDTYRRRGRNGDRQMRYRRGKRRVFRDRAERYRQALRIFRDRA